MKTNLDGCGVSIASVVLNNIPPAFTLFVIHTPVLLCKIYRAFSRTASHKNFFYLIKVEKPLRYWVLKPKWRSRAMYCLFAFDYQQEGKHLTLFGCRYCMQRILQDLLQLDSTEKIAAVVKDADSHPE